jgi:prepilin peptidase CpaA
MTGLAIFLIFPALVAFAGISDFLSMTISNRLCLLIGVAFIPVAISAGLAPTVVAGHLACATVGLAAGFAAFSFGWVGGGDAKLFSMVALWLGWSQIVSYTVITVLAGGVLAVVYLGLRLVPAGWIQVASQRVASFSQSEIPYGMALAAAALIVYPHSDWWSTLVTAR